MGNEKDEKKKIILLTRIVLISIESILGITSLIYGLLYTSVEEDRAETMLEFIKTNNPVYYEKLMSSDDPSYRREFYSFYTQRGNDFFILGGIILLVIAVNNIALLLNVVVTEKQLPVTADQSEEENTEDTLETGADETILAKK